MAATSYATPQGAWGAPVPTVWSPPARRSRFGDVVLVLFLLAQCFDGVFTYVGVLTFGIGVEANPLISGLMLRFGEAHALLSAKIVASGLGIALHLKHRHRAVAMLALFYLAAAILPWSAILFL